MGAIRSTDTADDTRPQSVITRLALSGQAGERVMFALLLLIVGLIGILGAVSWQSRRRQPYIRHALGVTRVPRTPKRIIALDALTLECLLALGVHPVGIPRRAALPRPLTEAVAGIPEIGSALEPDLATIAQLHPDLILGVNYFAHNLASLITLHPTHLISFEQFVVNYTHLSQLAPTIVLGHDGASDRQAVLQQCAVVLGKTTAAWSAFC